MKEALFRGLTTRKPCSHEFNYIWVEGDLIISDGKYYIHPRSNTVRVQGELGKLIVMHEVIPETVGQFTGLPDRKGKKIFVGDRCRVSRPCVLAYGKITFQNGCFWFVDDGPGGMLRLCDVKMNGFDVEVIGNIHDTLELPGGML